MTSIDFKLFGQSVRDRRITLGWSFQEMAHRAGITENTLARVQRGEPCSARTRQKLVDALVVSEPTLWTPELSSSAPFKIFSPETMRWSFMDKEQAKKWALNEEGSIDPESIQDESERLRLGRNGLSAAFITEFQTHLPCGYHGSVLVEVYQRFPAPPSSDVMAVTLYCLRGRLIIHLDNETVDFSEGEMIVYEGGVKAEYEPFEPVGPASLPPLLLCVPVHFRQPAGRKRIRACRK